MSEERMPRDMKAIWDYYRFKGFRRKDILPILKCQIKKDVAAGLRCKTCWSPIPCQLGCCQQKQGNDKGAA